MRLIIAFAKSVMRIARHVRGNKKINVYLVKKDTRSKTLSAYVLMEMFRSLINAYLLTMISVNMIIIRLLINIILIDYKAIYLF